MLKTTSKRKISIGVFWFNIFNCLTILSISCGTKASYTSHHPFDWMWDTSSQQISTFLSYQFVSYTLHAPSLNHSFTLNQSLSSALLILTWFYLTLSEYTNVSTCFESSEHLGNHHTHFTFLSSWSLYSVRFIMHIHMQNNKTQQQIKST